MKPGDRVGAIYRRNNDGSCELFGYGVYEGMHYPLEAVGEMADFLRAANVKNPRILLDSGEVVYGCECWWTHERECRAALASRIVRMVSITKVREEWHANNPSSIAS